MKKKEKNWKIGKNIGKQEVVRGESLIMLFFSKNMDLNDGSQRYFLIQTNRICWLE